MAVNKNFVVKNGLEVKSNLMVADTSQDSVGIGTSYIKEKLMLLEVLVQLLYLLVVLEQFM